LYVATTFWKALFIVRYLLQEEVQWNEGNSECCSLDPAAAAASPAAGGVWLA
jgi:hypothetical protein